jgi:hypothetical protein
MPNLKEAIEEESKGTQYYYIELKKRNQLIKLPKSNN